MPGRVAAIGASPVLIGLGSGTALVCMGLPGGDVGWGTLWMAGSVGIWIYLFLDRLEIESVTDGE